jgi:hypothetical protein
MNKHNDIHTILVAIGLTVTLIVGPAITYFISPNNAIAAQFKIDKSQFKKVM